MDKECFRHELRKALGHLCRLLIVRYLGAIVRARTTILLILAPTISWAENLDLQAQTFQQMYESICVENIKNLGDLKRRLKESSKLPPQEAANFSGGTTGEAWKVQSEQGVFILSIPNEENACTITAKRANPKLAEDIFLKFVTSTPPSKSARKIIDFYVKTETAGSIHTIGYTWDSEAPNEKILFTLTAVEHEYANTQAIASVKKLSSLSH